MDQKNFPVEKKISSKKVIYKTAEESLRSPIARKLFGFPWTQQVVVGENFVQVTKQDWVDWEVLEEPLTDLIREHFSQVAGDCEENPDPQAVSGANFLNSPEAQSLSEAIESRVNPMLAGHGGYAKLRDYKNNTAYVEMGGGCKGCGASYMTLKEGIETILKQTLPSLREVVDVTDHASGLKPYM